MKTERIIEILIENYSLGELEEYLEDITIASFEYGILDFVKEHKIELEQMLIKDCWFEED